MYFNWKADLLIEKFSTNLTIVYTMEKILKILINKSFWIK